MDRKKVLLDDQSRVKKRITKLIKKPKEPESSKNGRQPPSATNLNRTRAYYDKKQAEWEVG